MKPFRHYLTEEAIDKALSPDVRGSIIDKGGKIKCIVNDEVKVIDVDTSKDLLRAGSII